MQTDGKECDGRDNEGFVVLYLYSFSPNISLLAFSESLCRVPRVRAGLQPLRRGRRTLRSFDVRLPRFPLHTGFSGRIDLALTE